MPPRVSVIIPTFNRAKKLVSAIHSVLIQSDKSFELIVVDDGSESDLSEAKELLKKTNNHFFSISHGGVSRARNYGVSKSKGHFIAFLDSDDLWVENKLEKQLEFFAANPTYRICHTDEIWIRNGIRVNPKKKHQKASENAFSQSLKLCCISPSAVMMERGLFDLFKGFDEDLKVCEDYDLWLRITANNPIGLIDLPLVIKHGGHHDQLSRRESVMDRFRVYSLIKVLLFSSLNKEQESKLLAELRKKILVIIGGAKKREKYHLVDYLDGLLNVVDNYSNQGNLVYKNDLVKVFESFKSVTEI